MVRPRVYALIPALLFSFLFVPNHRAQAGFCSWLLEKEPAISKLRTSIRERVAKRRMESRLADFDFSIYLSEKEWFRENPLLRPRFGLLEEEIAYSESVLERADLRVSIGPGTSVSEDDWVRRERLFRLLSENPLSEGMTERRLDRFNSELFSIYHKSSISPLDLFTESGETRLESSARLELDRELSAHGLSRILSDLDLLVPEGKLRSQLSAVLENPRFRWTFALISNAGIAHGYLGYLPKMKWFRISPEMEKTLFESGTGAGEKAWSRLTEKERETLIGLRRRDVAYEGFRKAYLSAASIVLGVLVYDAYRDRKAQKTAEIDRIVEEIHSANVREKAENEKLLKMSDQELLFQNWEDDYRERNGGSVDTTSAEYRDAVRYYLER